MLIVVPSGHCVSSMAIVVVLVGLLCTSNKIQTAEYKDNWQNLTIMYTYEIVPSPQVIVVVPSYFLRRLSIYLKTKVKHISARRFRPPIPHAEEDLVTV